MNERCAFCGEAPTFYVKSREFEGPVCKACLKSVGAAETPARLIEALLYAKPAPGRCPYCGWTDSDFQRTGVLGCPQCYEALDPGLLAGFEPTPGAVASQPSVKKVS